MPTIFHWLKMHKRTLKGPKGEKLSQGTKIVVWIFFGLIAFLILKYVGNVIYPFLWALITAYLFAPLIYLLERKSRLPNIIWIILVYVILGIFIYWGLSILIPMVNSQLTQFLSDPAQMRSNLLSRLYLADKGTILGIEISYRQIIFQLQHWIKAQVPIFALPVLFSTLEHFLLIMLYLVFTFYILLDGEKYIKFFLMLTPSKFRREVRAVTNDINDTLGAYIRGLIILMFIMGFDGWIFLVLLKVDYALLLAVATGILEMIPLIGPIVATVLVALVALNQPVVAYGMTNVSLAAIIVIIYFILRQIEDYLIIPNVVGKFIHVHPVVVIFAVLIGAKMAGILGVFLALPVAAVIKILFYYFYPKLSD